MSYLNCPISTLFAQSRALTSLVSTVPDKDVSLEQGYVDGDEYDLLNADYSECVVHTPGQAAAIYACTPTHFLRLNWSYTLNHSYIYLFTDIHGMIHKFHEHLLDF